MAHWNDPEMVCITAELIHTSDGAYLITNGDTDDDDYLIEVWLPKSQTTVNSDGTFTIPEWLAIDKGLV